MQEGLSDQGQDLPAAESTRGHPGKGEVFISQGGTRNPRVIRTDGQGQAVFAP